MRYTANVRLTLPDESDPIKKHQVHLDQWCATYFDDGKANASNRHYERPRLATTAEKKAAKKDAKVWWFWRCR
jgi:hypothetical protein